jgi:hypothetical protein
MKPEDTEAPFTTHCLMNAAGNLLLPSQTFAPADAACEVIAAPIL